MMRRGGSSRFLAWGAALLSLASVARAAEGGGDVYAGDLGQAIAAILTFILLLVVLGRYAWRPLVAQLERRERQVADTVDRAIRKEQEAQELLEGYQARLRNVEEQARELLAQSRQQAEDAREQLLTEAREQARQTAEAQRRDMEQARQDAMKELHRTAAGLAADMARQVLKDRLTAEDHRRLLHRSLEDIRLRRQEGQG